MSDDFVSKIGFQYDPSAVQNFVNDVTKVNQTLAQSAAAAGKFNSAADSVRTSMSTMLSATQKATVNVTSYGDGVRKATVSINEIAPATQKATQAVNQFSESFQSAGRIATGVVLARSLGYLTQSFNESIDTAFKFEKAIANIQSISYESGISAQEWANELTKLSDAFNLPLLDSAEAAYQALQNQVVSGADSFKFLESSGKLAAVTVSSMSASVEALTGVINAYEMSASEAQRVSELLFVAQREGRFVLDDIANSIGNTAIVASQAGISFEELLASFTALTLQGVKANEAMTAMRNVIEKIIRPTDDLKGAIFEAFGVTPIEALNQMGLIRFLEETRRLSGEGVKGLAEFADLWGRIRSVTGAVGITKNLDRVLSIMEDLNASSAQFGRALQEITGSRQFILGKELQQFSNEIVKSFGNAVISTGELINNLVDVSDALSAVTKTVGILVAVGLPAWLLKVAINGGIAAAGLQTVATTGAVVNTTLTATGTAAAATSARLSLLSGLTFGGAVAGAMALGAAFGYLANRIIKATTEASKLRAMSVQELVATNTVELAKSLAELQAQTDSTFTQANSFFNSAMQGMTRSLSQFTGAIEKNLAKQQALKTTIESLKTAQSGRQADIARRKGDFVGEANIVNQEAFKVLEQIRKLSEQPIIDPKELNKLDSLFEGVLGRLENVKAKFNVNGLMVTPAQQVTRLLEARSAIDANILKKLETEQTLTQQQIDEQTLLNERYMAGVTALEAMQPVLKGNLDNLKALTEEADRLQATLRAATEGKNAEVIKQVLEKTKTSEAGKKSADAVEALNLGFDDNLKLSSKQLDEIIAKFRTAQQELQSLPSTVLEFSMFDNLNTKINSTLESLTAAKTAQADLEAATNTFFQKFGSIDIGELSRNVQILTNQLGPAFEQGLSNAGQEAIAGSQRLLDITNQIEQLRNRFDGVSVEQVDAINQSTSTWNAALEAGMTTAQQIQQQAEAALATAQKALETALQAQAAAGATGSRPLRQFMGGSVRRYATGGVGMDRIPAMLSPGEFVMNSRTTSSFFPQIVAMNSGSKTPRFSSGGNVTVGDVNVTVEGGNTSEKTARSIANELRREIKRGLVRLD